jgi:hypothetical protein
VAGSFYLAGEALQHVRSAAGAAGAAS